MHAAAVSGRLARLVRFVCAPELIRRMGSDRDARDEAAVAWAEESDEEDG